MNQNDLKDLEALCIKKTQLNMTLMGDTLREYPSRKDGFYFTTHPDDSKDPLDLSHIFVWTPSFFTGMGALAYQSTHDPMYIQWLNQFYSIYHHKVFETPLDTMHDLGFLYSPYSVALYKLTGDINQRDVALKAADELAKRFYPRGNYIRAWGKLDNTVPSYVSQELAQDHFFTESKGLAIIDCMMNLPLLYWASETTGSPFYRNIANAHADMTQRYFIREDGTPFHAYRFHEDTGEPLGGTNYCGYSKDSYWARGASWAIYGFAIAYRYTGDRSYLETSKALVRSFIKESEGTIIPTWDFRLPPEKKPHQDSSAAAVVACALLELYSLEKNQDYMNYFYTIMEKLSSQKYLNRDDSCSGILDHTNKSEGYWICGDYFFMEAVVRGIHGGELFW